MNDKALTVKEFIKLLDRKDINKVICVFNTISGNRIPVTIDDIDWDIDGILDINLSTVLE